MSLQVTPKDPGTLLGELRASQSSLRRRIEKASAGDVFTAEASKGFPTGQ